MELELEDLGWSSEVIKHIQGERLCEILQALEEEDNSLKRTLTRSTQLHKVEQIQKLVLSQHLVK